MTIIERVERAIAENQHKAWLYNERACSMLVPDKLAKTRLELNNAARAAIAALREPTEAMMNAGYDIGYSPEPLPVVDLVWRAMIDAVLTDQNTPEKNSGTREERGTGTTK